MVSGDSIDMKIELFKREDFRSAVGKLFRELDVPVSEIADEPTTAQEVLQDTYKENDTFKLIEDVYFVGMVDDAAFQGNKSLETDQIKSDYEGVLIFGLTLHPRENDLLPTRSQLAEIARAFNREFFYTPVVLVFKYQNTQGEYLAFANTERLKYKQEWREGEKAGKVSLLRDIDIENPHRGHEDILEALRIPTSGTKAVDSFAKLYTYWQEVFSVSVLNKKFYQELSNWYFWAVNHVTFPSKPTPQIAHQKGVELNDLIKEHNATNVIRLLTRLLFTWFIKEKKLVPEELFDLHALQKDILKEISPYHEEGTMFAQANKDSVYYKAILQNLFFATLNCPIEADGVDNRSRGFRGDGYGTHRGVDYLMRYKKYFKNPDAFLALMNQTVPFLNGGLFECLDDKYQNLYIDGFSDQMTKGEQLTVPDYLFFGVEEQVDLSKEYGVSNSGTKKAAVKGLINILKSYKFTITENTPIEEDVALDPELLGKVFENLLASYNPETKTTARKQTGSFYTPREIVNYMVDESLIAYLKTKILDSPEVFADLGSSQSSLFGNDGKKGQLGLVNSQGGSEFNGKEEQLDQLLRELISFDPGNPFADYPKTTAIILQHLNACKILDPACGSGAFPMGVLQKMVHVLQKLDPENQRWKEVQKEKAKQEAEAAFEIEDKQERSLRLKEIDEAFDQNINDPDYARKLFLIENCIYGVDIQPIATQIAKLRFFISLVVDQKKNEQVANFGIRPLPNLETKFVTANTLIDIEKPDNGQLAIFDGGKLKELEKELKKIRSKLFGARTKETKLKYRMKDEELRNAIAEELINTGWPNDAAKQLAQWDPYDQNAASPFFNPEWMFDLSNGFDIVIGNPPYKLVSKEESNEQAFYRKVYRMASYKINLYVLFLEKGLLQVSYGGGIISFIIPKSLVFNTYLKESRNLLLTKYTIPKIIEITEKVFENAEVGDNIIFFGQNKNNALQNFLKYQVVKSISPFTLIKEFENPQNCLSPLKDWTTLK
jgi:type I restriction-modification system DNA methylase subunit